MGKLESKFQASIIKRLQAELPGCVVLKNDPGYMQGIPDILVLFNDRWAMLEIKKSPTASAQPNQEYYVDLLNSMSYAAFIYPENEEYILAELQRALQPHRKARVPKS